jgi:hypothetical protein
VANGNNLRFYGTTLGSSGTAQTDTTQWLGHHRSSTRLEQFQSTATASQTDRDRHILVDSSRIGDGADAHVFKWVLVLTGPGSLGAGRVMSFDSATGTYVLDRRLASANVASGNFYALFQPNAVFPAVTDAQSIAGETRFRGIFMLNETSGTITVVRYHFVQLEGLGDGTRALSRLHQTTDTAPFMRITNEFTDVLGPSGSRVLGDASDGFAGSGGWEYPYSRDTAHPEDASLPFGGGGGGGHGIFLRRVVPALSRARKSVAYLLIVSSSTTGQDPSPLTGGAIIAWDVNAADPTLTFTPDRFTQLRGGARYTLHAERAGVSDPGLVARFEVDPGLGTIHTENDPTTLHDTTDANGDAHVTHRASAATVDEGDPEDVRAIVTTGTEEANPT